MTTLLRSTLLRLLDAIGPSGAENAAAATWLEIAEDFATKCWTDVHGNTFAESRSDGELTVMLAGHIDEIGLMVHHVDEDGFLFVKGVGGWDPQVLVGQRVRFQTPDGPVVGVVGRRAIHLLESSERQKAVKLDDLWVDVGSESGVGVGDVCVIESDTLEMGESRVAGRSVDDRAGAAVAIEVMRRSVELNLPVRVVGVATVQEEIGWRSGGGARTSSFQLRPDHAIVIDVTHATDHPRADKRKFGDIELGGGPVLTRGSILNAAMTDGLRDAAERCEASVQWQAAPSATGTDADTIFTTRAGIPTALISLPNRYMHSPSQMVDLVDLEGAVEVIVEYVKGLGENLGEGHGV